ncbi:hypothetical protein NLI96_g4392 [Meripilus lineatus]|uniref:Uncharacterized protein n=1 Tax=Meripilus lineatus TaxID=2056292 RepID=A0AAD5V6N8_9APHY|nr:hypothetical protein NLI96_g4392 [Physisporinus lineatus]
MIVVCIPYPRDVVNTHTQSRSVLEIKRTGVRARPVLSRVVFPDDICKLVAWNIKCETNTSETCKIVFVQIHQPHSKAIIAKASSENVAVLEIDGSRDRKHYPRNITHDSTRYPNTRPYGYKLNRFSGGL